MPSYGITRVKKGMGSPLLLRRGPLGKGSRLDYSSKLSIDVEKGQDRATRCKKAEGWSNGAEIIVSSR